MQNKKVVSSVLIPASILRTPPPISAWLLLTTPQTQLATSSYFDEVRLVNDRMEIKFKGKIFKILAPCVKPYDRVLVSPSDQGVVLFCEGARVALPYIEIILSDIGLINAHPRKCPHRSCQLKNNARH